MVLRKVVRAVRETKKSLAKKLLERACLPEIKKLVAFESLEGRQLMTVSPTLVGPGTLVQEGVSSHWTLTSDQNAPLMWTVDWGDGTPASVVYGDGDSTVGVHTLTADHTYADGPQTWTVTATAYDSSTMGYDAPFGPSQRIQVDSYQQIDPDVTGSIATGGNAAVRASGGYVVAVQRNGGNGELRLYGFNDDGSTDLHFGNYGVTVTDLPMVPIRTVESNDGSIFVVGGITQGSDANKIAIVRFRSDGSLDTDFGTGGQVVTDLQNSGYGATVTLHEDVITVAALNLISPTNIRVVSYATTGSGSATISPTFTTNLADPVHSVADVAVMSGGSDVLILSKDGYLYKFQSDGTPYSGFTQGATETPPTGYRHVTPVYLDGFPHSRPGWNESGHIRLFFQPDGKILVAGTISRDTAPIRAYAVARFNVDGTIDTTYGTLGVASALVQVNGDYVDSYAASAVQQKDGSILIGGWSTGTGVNNFTIARINATGGQDTSFQWDSTITDFEQGDTSLDADMILDAAGRLIVTGTDVSNQSVPAHNAAFILQRFSAIAYPVTTIADVHDVPRSFSVEPDTVTSMTEGSTYGIHVAVDPDPSDTVSSWRIDWGDNSYTRITPAEFSLAGGHFTHVYADDGNAYGSSDGHLVVTVTATDEDGSYTQVTSVTVTDPTVWTQSYNAYGAATARTGQPYTLTVLSTDPGFGTPVWTITWDTAGSQTISVITGRTGQATHTFSTAGNHTVTITFADEDGVTHVITETVTGTTASPSISVAGNGSVAEGTDYGITLTSAATPTNPASWSIDWGDGSSPQLFTATSGSVRVTHLYSDDGAFVIQAGATISSVPYAAAPSFVTVHNTAPTLTLAGTSAPAEGSIYTLTLTSSDYSTDRVRAWVINWGDGSDPTVVTVTDPGTPISVVTTAGGTYTLTEYTATATHSYTDGKTAGGPTVYTITAIASDEDSNYSAAANVSVYGSDPTVTLGGDDTAIGGQPYTLQINQIDADVDTLWHWRIDWGDGSVDDFYGRPTALQHRFVNLDGPRVISVTAGDEDGSYAGIATKTVTVTSVGTTLKSSGWRTLYIDNDNFVVTVATSGVDLTWDDNRSNVSDWLVYVLYPNTTTWTTLTTIHGATSAHVTNPDPFGQYYFKVAPMVAGVQMGAFSNVVRTMQTPTLNFDGTTYIGDDDTGPVDHYVIELAPDPGGTFFEYSGVSGGWTSLNLPEGDYLAHVRAIDGYSKSPPSIWTDGWNPFGHVGDFDNAHYSVENGGDVVYNPDPLNPTLNVTSRTESQIQIAWTAYLDDIAGQVGLTPEEIASNRPYWYYSLYQSTDGINYTFVDDVTSLTSYTLYNLTPGQSYYYQIRGSNLSYHNADYSIYYNYSYLVNASTATLYAPVSLTATTNSSRKVDLHWESYTRAETGLQVQARSRTNDNDPWGDWDTLTTLAPLTESYTVGNLEPNTHYEFRIVGVKESGDGIIESDPSNTADAWTKPAITLTGITPVGGRQIRLDWVLDEDAGGTLTIYRKRPYGQDAGADAGQYDWNFLATPLQGRYGAQSFIDDAGIEPGRSYLYKLVLTLTDGTQTQVFYSEPFNEGNFRTTTFRPGDATGDGIIDSADVGMSNYGQSQHLIDWEYGNFNNDLLNDSADAAIMTQALPGQGTPHTFTATGPSPSTIQEQAVYTLTLNYQNQGKDVIDYWRVDWGDGTTTDFSDYRMVYTTNSIVLTHVYRDGGSGADNAIYNGPDATDPDSSHHHNPVIHVTAHDFETLFTQDIPVTVTNVAPSVFVGGPGYDYPSLPYALSLDAWDIADDTVTTFTINWGDGTTSTYDPSSTRYVDDNYVTPDSRYPSYREHLIVTHLYPAGGPTSGTGWVITASATDEDGTYDALQSVTVTWYHRQPLEQVLIDPLSGEVKTTTASLLQDRPYIVNPDDGQPPRDPNNGELLYPGQYREYNVIASGIGLIDIYHLRPTDAEYYNLDTNPKNGVITTGLDIGLKLSDTDGNPQGPLWRPGISATATYAYSPSHVYSYWFPVGTVGQQSFKWVDKPTLYRDNAGLLAVDIFYTEPYVTGAPTVDEAATYTVQLSGNNNGDVDVSAWVIDWGDGFVQTISGSPTNATHVYADGPTDHVVTATAYHGGLPGGGGVAYEPRMLDVQVQNVAPTVQITGATTTVTVGNSYTLNLFWSDPGADRAMGWTVDWGDGNVQFIAGNPSQVTHVFTSQVTHVFTDRVGAHTISAVLSDDDGLWPAAATVSVDVQAQPASVTGMLAAFQDVYNTVAYQPYAGVMKGAQGTLATKAGNDWDQAVLLASKLQLLGISSSYVSGRVTASVGDLEAWLGVKDGQAAYAVLTAAGLNPTATPNASAPTSITFDHVWLSVTAEGSPYTLDPSWKFKNRQAGLPDAYAVNPFPLDIFTYLSTASASQTPLESFRIQFEGTLFGNLVQPASVAEAAFDGPIIARTFTTAPTPSYTISGTPTVLSSIPTASKHRIRITVTSGGNQLFAPVDLDAYTIGSQAVTLDYDASLHATLKVGASSWTAAAGLTSGADVTIQVEVFDPGATGTPSNTLIVDRKAGQRVAIAVDAQQLAASTVASAESRLAADAVAGTFPAADLEDRTLALIGQRFFNQADDQTSMIAGWAATVWVRNRVRVAFVSADSAVDQNANLPSEYSSPNATVDMTDALGALVPIAGPNTLNDTLTSAYKLIGLNTTSLAERAGEAVEGADFASALSGVISGYYSPDGLLAYSPGYPSDLSTIPANVRPIIQADIDAGYTVTVTNGTITLGTWTGVAWIREKISADGSEVSGRMMRTTDAAPISATIDAAIPTAPTVSSAIDPWSTLVAGGVNGYNGNLTRNDVDLSIPNTGFDLTFARHYDSASSVDLGMGQGWLYSYVDYLDLTDLTHPVWVTSTGVRYTFTQSGVSTYTNPKALFGTFAKTASNEYTFTDTHGTVSTFDASGRLREVRDRYDNFLTISHNAAGQPTLVQDGVLTDRTLSFHYDASGHLDTVTDFAGRSWTYTYQSLIDPGTNDWVVPTVKWFLVDVATPAPQAGQPPVHTTYSYFNQGPLHGLLQAVSNARAAGGDAQYHYFPNRWAESTTGGEGNTATVSYDLTRHETTVVDPRGAASSYTFQAIAGRISSIINPDGTRVKYGWNVISRLLVSKIDELGRQESWTYDTTAGDLLGHTTPDGHTTYTYDSYHLVHTSTDFAGNVTTYTHDSLGNVTSIEDPTFDETTMTHNVTTMTYDSRGRVTARTDPKGNVPSPTGNFTTTYTYSYDPSIHAETRTASNVVANADGQIETITVTMIYDALGDLGIRTDGRQLILSTYDLLGERLTNSVFDASNLSVPLAVTTYTYSNFNLASVTEPGGATTSYEYDRNRRLTREVFPETDDNGVTSKSYAYDPDGNRISVTDELGHVTRYFYDARNRLVETLAADGTTTGTGYDGVGHTVATTDALGHTTLYYYTPYTNNLERVTAPDPTTGQTGAGPVTQYGYDINNNRTSVTDPRGNTTFYQYDADGRQTAVIQPRPEADPSVQGAWNNVYGGEGYLLPTGQQGGVNPVVSIVNATTTTWSSVSSSDPRALAGPNPGDTPSLGAWTAPTTSNVDIHLNFTDGQLHEVTLYLVDYQETPGISRVMSVVLYNTDWEWQDYRTVKDFQNGTYVTFLVSGQAIIELTSPSGMGPGVAVSGIFIDTPGPSQTTSYDANGNVTTVTDANTNTTTYEYDSLNRKIRTSRPAGTATVDASGNSVTGTLDTKFYYDASNNLTKVTDPLNRSSTYAYDALNRKTGESHPSATYVKDDGTIGTGTSIGYAYDAAGDLTTVVNANGNATTYAYDARHRKTDEYLPSPDGDDTHRPHTHYTYDAVGNLTAVATPAPNTLNGTPAVTTTYDYDALNRKTKQTNPSTTDNGVTSISYAYDANGNLTTLTDANGYTTTYHYDALNRKIDQVNPTTTYVDETGTTVTTITTLSYAYDADGNLVAVTDARGHTTTYTYDALNRKTSQVAPSVTYTTDSGTQSVNPTTTYTYDANGNLTAIITPAPFGTLTSPAVTVTYEYDALNRKTDEYRPAPDGVYDPINHVDHRPHTQYRYDAAGNLVEVITPAPGTITGAPAVTTTYKYDALNRKTSQALPGSGTLFYGYDAVGNLLWSQDANATTPGTPDNFTTWYKYDALNRKTDEYLPNPDVASHAASGYAGSGPHTQYQYDAAGNLTTVTAPAPGSASFAPAVVTAYSYDNLHRKTLQTLPSPATPGAAGPQTAYAYDAAGNLTTVTTPAPNTTSFAPSVVTAYSYDPLNRKTGESHPSATYLNDADSVITGTSVAYAYDANGNLVAVTDANGNKTTYTYDALNRKTAQVAPTVTVYSSDSSGTLSAPTPATPTTRYGYDPAGNLISVQDANATTTSVTGAGSNTTWYRYDALGRKTAEVRPNPSTGSSLATITAASVDTNPTSLFGYDALGNLLWSKDPNGTAGSPTPGDTSNHTTWYQYDLAGRKTDQYLPDPATGDSGPVATGTVHTHYAYDNDGRLTSVASPAPNNVAGTVVTSYAYDALGRTLTETHPAATYLAADGTFHTGTTISYAYDARGNRTSVTDANGNTTTYDYDLLGRKTAQVNPATTYVTDPNPSGVTTVVTGPTTTTYAYDAAGNLVAVTDARGHTTTYKFDDLGRKIEDTLPQPGAAGTAPHTLYQYDANGNLVKVVTPQPGSTSGDAVVITTYAYDALNRKTGESHPSATYVKDDGTIGTGTSIGYAYDKNGNLVATTDARGNTCIYVYDALGRKIKQVNPSTTDNGVTSISYEYDVNGNLTTLTDARGKFTTYAYDALNRKTGESHPSATYINDAGSVITGTTITYAYDAAGNLVATTDARGYTIGYSYDTMNRKIEETLPSPDTDSSHAPHTQYEYDANGNLVAVVTPAPGTMVGAATFTTTYAYDALNRKTDEIKPAPDGVYDPINHVDHRPHTHYSYDANGNLVAVATPAPNTLTGAATITTTYAYDALNRKTKQINPITAYATDPDPSGVTTVISDKTTVTYAYDAVGNLTAVTDARGHTTTYEYDALSRKTKQVNPAIPVYGVTSVAYAYDANGNLAAVTDANGNKTTYTYDALNRKTKQTNPSTPDNGDTSITYAYDANGNLTTLTDANNNVTAHAYDALNRKISDTLPPTKHYDDATGVVVTNAVTTISYSYNANGNVVAVTDARGKTTSYVYDHLGHKTNDRLPLTPYWRWDGATLTQVTDTVLVLTYTYDTFGNLLSSTDALGNTTSYDYDRLGRKTAQVNPATTYVDETGTTVTTITTLSYAYDLLGNLTTVTDARGHVATYAYDALNHKTDEHLPTGAHTHYDYDAVGNLVNVVTPAPNTSNGTPAVTTSYEYDALNRKTKQINPTVTYYVGSTSYTGSTSISYGYDKNGNLTAVTDARGNTTAYTYDALNRKVTQVTPSASYANASGTVGTGTVTTTYTYDANGNLTVIQSPAPGSTTSTDPVVTATYVYDALNRKTEEISPVGAHLYYGYDANGNTVYIVNALATTMQETGGYDATWYKYDALNRKTDEYLPRLDTGMSGYAIGDDYRKHFDYDANGHVVRMTDRLGYTYTYKYDALGRQTTATQPSVSVTTATTTTVPTSALATPVTRSGYDAAGNLIWVQDANATNADNHATWYKYDALNRKTDEYKPNPDNGDSGYAVAGPHSTWTYDAAGNLVNVVTPGTTTNTPVAITTYAYDALHRMTDETAPSPDGSTASLAPHVQYRYDANGNKVAVVSPQPGVQSGAPTLATTYTYDALNRTTSKTEPPVSHLWSSGLETVVTVHSPVTSYSYDRAGNLTRQTDPTNQTTVFTYDAAGHTLTSTQLPTHDAAIDDGTAGNWTASYGSSGWWILDGDSAGLMHITGATITGGTCDNFGTLSGDDTDNRIGDGFLEEGGGDKSNQFYHSADANTAITITVPHPENTSTYRVSIYVQKPTSTAVDTAISERVAITDSTGTYYQNIGYWLESGNSNQLDWRWGRYLSWNVTGDVTIVITNLDGGDGAPVVEGVFRDPYQAPTTAYTYDLNGNVTQVSDPEQRLTLYQYDNWGRKTGQTQRASYDASIDDRTKGYWVGTYTTWDPSTINGRTATLKASNMWYGNTGYRIPTATGPAVNIPADITFAWTSNHATATVSHDNDDLRQVYDPDTGSHNRTSSTRWYDLNQLSFVVTFPADTTYRLSLYMVDWITGGENLHRSQRVDVYDNDTGALLGHEIVSDFSQGRYVSFNVRGNVKVEVTNWRSGKVGTVDRDATLDAIFIDPGEEYVTGYTYDHNGNLKTLTDPEGNVTTYFYDSLNRKITERSRIAYGMITTSTVDTVLRERTYGYDAVGNLTREGVGEYNVSDNVRRAFTYDALNRNTNEIWWDNSSGTYTLTNTIHSGYDTAGNLIRTWEKLGADTTRAVDTTYTYDYLHRITQSEDKGFESFTVPPPSDVFTQTYTYDALSNKILVVDSGLQQASTTTYTYDTLGRLESVNMDGPNFSHSKTSYLYDLAGRTLRISRGTFDNLSGGDYIYTAHLMTVFTYDYLGRLNTQKELEGSNTDIAALPSDPDTRHDYGDYTYTYYDDGKLRDSRAPFGDHSDTYPLDQFPTLRYHYRYDGAGQLIIADSAMITDKNEITRYTPNGNVANEKLLYGPNNVLLRDTTDATVTYEYDLEGNLVHKVNSSGTTVTTYIWDNRNRLVQAQTAGNGSVSYTYDNENRRTLRKPSGGNNESYLYDGDNLVAVIGGPANPNDTTHYVTGLNGAIVAQENAETSGSHAKFSWLMQDYQGTTAYLADFDAIPSTSPVRYVTNHLQYTSTGVIFGTPNVTRIGYTGQIYDAITSFEYHHERYFDNANGRFISEDPLGFAGGDTNLYRYANNDPVNNADPDGTSWLSELWHTTWKAISHLFEDSLHLLTHPAEIANPREFLRQNAQIIGDTVAIAAIPTLADPEEVRVTAGYLADPVNTFRPKDYAKQSVVLGIETASAGPQHTGLSSAGLDLFFINASAGYSHGHRTASFGLFGAEVAFDYYKGELDTNVGAHVGFGIPGVIGVGASYMGSTASVSAYVGPVSVGASYNVHGYWNGSVGIGLNLGYGVSVGYGLSFGHDGTHAGFSVSASYTGGDNYNYGADKDGYLAGLGNAFVDKNFGGLVSAFNGEKLHPSFQVPFLNGTFTDNGLQFQTMLPIGQGANNYLSGKLNEWWHPTPTLPSAATIGAATRAGALGIVAQAGMAAYDAIKGVDWSGFVSDALSQQPPIANPTTGRVVPTEFGSLGDFVGGMDFSKDVPVANPTTGRVVPTEFGSLGDFVGGMDYSAPQPPPAPSLSAIAQFARSGGFGPVGSAAMSAYDWAQGVDWSGIVSDALHSTPRAAPTPLQTALLLNASFGNNSAPDWTMAANSFDPSDLSLLGADGIENHLNLLLGSPNKINIDNLTGPQLVPDTRSWFQRKWDAIENYFTYSPQDHSWEENVSMGQTDSIDRRIINKFISKPVSAGVDLVDGTTYNHTVNQTASFLTHEIQDGSESTFSLLASGTSYVVGKGFGYTSIGEGAYGVDLPSRQWLSSDERAGRIIGGGIQLGSMFLPLAGSVDNTFTTGVLGRSVVADGMTQGFEVTLNNAARYSTSSVEMAPMRSIGSFSSFGQNVEFAFDLGLDTTRDVAASRVFEAMDAADAGLLQTWNQVEPSLADEVAILRRIGDTNRASAVFHERISLKPMVLDGNVQGLIDALDVSSPVDKAVFWSKAGLQAQEFARSIGGVTLEMTPGGQVVDNWSFLAKNLPWESGGKDFWSGLSRKYAGSASGDTYYLKGGDGYIWNNVEQPELSLNPNVGPTKIHILNVPSDSYTYIH